MAKSSGRSGSTFRKSFRTAGPGICNFIKDGWVFTQDVLEGVFTQDGLGDGLSFRMVRGGFHSGWLGSAFRMDKARGRAIRRWLRGEQTAKQAEWRDPYLRDTKQTDCVGIQET